MVVLTQDPAERPVLDWRQDMEPHLLGVLDRKHARQGKGSYKPRRADDVAECLDRLLAASGARGVARNVRRMGGGASKEQFLFDLLHEDGTAETLVLRMDPLEGIVETCRAREAQLLAAIAGVVPAPPVAFVDGDGAIMGQPAMVARFVRGVTKPRDATSGPSGVGIVIGERSAALLMPQYIDYLVEVNAFDFAGADLPAYAVPRAGTN